MKVYYGKMSWDGCIFTFNVSFRKKNYDYLIEFETSRHYLTIYLFSAWPESSNPVRFMDRLFGKIEASKCAKNAEYNHKRWLKDTE